MEYAIEAIKVVIISLKDMLVLWEIFFFLNLSSVYLILVGIDCNWDKDQGRSGSCCREAHYFASLGMDFVLPFVLF